MKTRADILALARSYHDTYRKHEAGWLATMQRVNKDKPTCTRKCSACCRQLTLGTLISGVLIADELAKRGDIDLALSATRQGNEQAKLLMDKEHSDAADVWWQRYEACVFLKDDECTVYDLRPPCCSSYYVISAPAQCAVLTSRTMVKSYDNNPLYAHSMAADSSFMAEVLDDPTWQNSLIVGPLGMMVSAGILLLRNVEEFRGFAQQFVMRMPPAQAHSAPL